MCRSSGIALLALPIWMVMARLANGGMPSISLTDIASLRLQAISFFLVGFLLSAAIIRWIWNSLAKDFSFLPRVTFLKSCGMLALWGLLFMIVLTMISGARELMTPGAWEKEGYTYRLKDETGTAAPDHLRRQEQLADRVRQLKRLNGALQSQADREGGQYPQTLDAINSDRLVVPHARDQRYQYVGGRQTADVGLPLAYEPDCFDDDPLVLFADGTVRPVPIAELRQLLDEEPKS